MTDATSKTAQGDESPERLAALPRTSAETVTLLAHFYRGELARMISWRDRIDRTTNWAIATVAGMLSISLSTTTSHHGVLLFAMVLVLLLHFIEARRYRYYDVYRDRVRMFERRYLTRVLGGESPRGPEWETALAESLQRPQFTVSRLGAMSRRLRRNYGWMYLILLLAWALKTLSPRLQPEGVAVSWRTPLENFLATASLGPLSAWVVLVSVALFYGCLGYMALQPDQGEDQEAGEVHV
jgi:uncharacterized membrane protein